MHKLLFILLLGSSLYSEESLISQTGTVTINESFDYSELELGELQISLSASVVVMADKDSRVASVVPTEAIPEDTFLHVLSWGVDIDGNISDVVIYATMYDLANNLKVESQPVSLVVAGHSSELIE